MVFTEIKYQPERTKTYLGSPSIVRLPDGSLVASHDYFGAMRDMRNNNCLTSIYRSEDNGKTWIQTTHLIGAFWGTLFVHRSALWHISISGECGHIVIRKSGDGGFTWSVPSDEKHGLLFQRPDDEYSTWHFGGATPVLLHGGRLWKGFDRAVRAADEPPWIWRADMFHSGVLSCPEDADPLDAANWRMSGTQVFDAARVRTPGLAERGNGWLEGSVVEAPDGTLCSMQRIHLRQPGKAAILRVLDEGRAVDFDYDTGIPDFIGGHAKFTVRRDPVTQEYFTLTNAVTEEFPEARNRLVLASSPDLRHWSELKTVLEDDTGLVPARSAELTGFQYCDWQFDDEDIIFACRTAYRGAHNYHDSNRITFHTIQNFRKKRKGNDLR